MAEGDFTGHATSHVIAEIGKAKNLSLMNAEGTDQGAG